MESVKISVRELAEYAHRRGDIDERFRSRKALTEGTAIHQEVQKEYKDTEEREVYLEYVYETSEAHFHIHGRCDGVLFEEDGPVIDEIKSTALEVEELEEDRFPEHWGQAYGYAFLYCKQEDLPGMHVQLTYVQKTSKQKERYRRYLSVTQLEEEVAYMVNAYTPYASILLRMREQREKTVPDLGFPFPSYREGQRTFAGSVYRTATEGRTLFAQAPTGIGKTISSLFPGIKALGGESLDQLYYATAKTTTRETAEEAIGLMQKEGLSLTSVTLTAKEKICFQEETICQPEYCQFADGYYDRINGALVDILTEEPLLSREVIEAYARKHTVCPFEFSLDLTYAADVTIGDYNYIYDPRVALKRLSRDRTKKMGLLVDEAHNLVERARDMYSASLVSSEFEAVSTLVTSDYIKKLADSIQSDISTLFQEHGREFSTDDIPGLLEERLEAFVEEMEAYLRDLPPEEQEDDVMNAYFVAQHFLNMLELKDDHFVYLGKQGEELKLYCLNPSVVVRNVTKAYRFAVYFSATLSPFAYYKEMLGGTPEDYILRLPSPFKKEQITPVFTPLSTRFKDRERTAEHIADQLKKQTEDHPGNHLFFFPSYHYLDLVYAYAKKWGKRVVVQERNMDEERKKEFLDQFTEQSEIIGFAVLGGVFSEGVDLKGERLVGVAIVGVALPPRSIEKELIEQYFKEQGKNGYYYAYVYPGMNKVLQAGGRLIRSEEDHGVIQFIDDRFKTPLYQQLLPDEWQPR
ncbi:helicase C-terminal domain-containing protein [Salimicrobium halophilum]|uniref:Rad3-related DNA helicase n=1 Tax=Salimicrobium halophilum TaxID=86666 RepID=A0A1G8SVJ2_9BACI|nr:helicase C-terminal domain-containing protein [Salimicrobium halophilum]SDJ33246.1 Rad3-related DNA helicase [Salimicrobium halophilum]